DGWGTVSESLHPIVDLRLLLRDQLSELVFIDTNVMHGPTIDVDRTSFGDRADAQLGLDGRADLADDTNVERCSELARNLIGDRNASAGKAQNHRSGISVMAEGSTKLAPCISPILEELAGTHTHTPSTSVPSMPQPSHLSETAP